MVLSGGTAPRANLTASSQPIARLRPAARGSGQSTGGRLGVGVNVGVGRRTVGARLGAALGETFAIELGEGTGAPHAAATASAPIARSRIVSRPERVMFEPASPPQRRCQGAAPRDP
jgi:hypothetical protein